MILGPSDSLTLGEGEGDQNARRSHTGRPLSGPVQINSVTKEQESGESWV